MKKPVVQEDGMGCGIACAAFVLNKNYKTTKKYFKNLGSANTKGFTSRGIVKALSKAGKNYKTNYIKNKIKFKENSIVYIRKSKNYPHGHYLVYTKKGLMDPWINMDPRNIDIKKAKAGFRKKLPYKATYCIHPLFSGSSK